MKFSTPKCGRSTISSRASRLNSSPPWWFVSNQDHAISLGLLTPPPPPPPSPKQPSPERCPTPPPPAGAHQPYCSVSPVFMAGSILEDAHRAQVKTSATLSQMEEGTALQIANLSQFLNTQSVSQESLRQSLFASSQEASLKCGGCQTMENYMRQTDEYGYPLIPYAQEVCYCTLLEERDSANCSECIDPRPIEEQNGQWVCPKHY